MSAINTGSINVNYPTPGINNSSQGFRDNFTGIKNNLDTASTEITELQNKVILKSALVDLPLNNDMGNTLITNALIQGFRSTTYNLGNNLSGAVTIDLTKGDVQYGTATSNVNLGFSGWAPSGTYSSVDVILTVNSSSIAITLPSSVTIGIKTLENYSTPTVPGGNVIILGSLGVDSPSILHWRFSTKDCGTSIEITPLNRPRRATQLTTTVPSTNIGNRGDRTGAIAMDSAYLYVCIANWDGINPIWKRVTLSAW